MALANSATRQQVPNTMFSTYIVLTRRNQSSSCEGRRQADERGDITMPRFARRSSL